MAKKTPTRSRVASRTSRSRKAGGSPRAAKPAPQPVEADLVGVGVIRKSHGIRGEASVEPLTDSVERFHDLAEVTLVSRDRKTLRPARIDAVRTHGGRVLVHFDGVNTPEEIRELTNWSIEIREDQLRPLQAGEYFLHDLVGLQVIAPEGRVVGTTTEAQDTAAGILLTVRKSDGRTFELPFAESICLKIDTRGRKLVADIPVGLEDLDQVAAIEEETVAGPSAETASLRIDVVTIFPKMFDPFLEEGVIARARKNGLLNIRVWDLRDFSADKHRSTDDEAYGGGAGMVMLGEPIFRCLEALGKEATGEPWVVLLSPQGRRFSQSLAGEMARRSWLVFLCGRYEGIDERVREMLVDEEISVGDFVVSGGEVPAMLVIDALARLVEGVVGDWNSVKDDSFYNGLLDHPHYTRPAELRGMRVPEVLLSGHAEKIRRWRREQALRATLAKRPDLLVTAELDDEAREILDKIRDEATGSA